MKKSLVALALGTFALGIAEFGMMGILGDVARGFGLASPALVGTPLAFVGAVALFALYRRYDRR